MDNYIMFNGEKIPLTPEQIKLMSEQEEKTDYFTRLKKQNCSYYYITGDGTVTCMQEKFAPVDDKLFDTANYCTNMSIMKQRALHEILNRRLWRFSEQNGGGKIDWNDSNIQKWCIFWDGISEEFGVELQIFNRSLGTVHFTTIEVAERAIKEIVKPFIAEHSGIKW